MDKLAKELAIALGWYSESTWVTCMSDEKDDYRRLARQVRKMVLEARLNELQRTGEYLSKHYERGEELRKELESL